MLVGCTGAGGGNLALSSQFEQGVTLESNFESGTYRFDDRNHVTVVLVDGPMENPRQAVTLRMFWEPRAGRTPIDQDATNATIHYVIFAGEGDREAGVYSGAGFVYPKDKPGGAGLSAGVWQASLIMTDRSEMFDDLLGQAKLKGTFTARRDDLATSQMIDHLNRLITQRLQYPRVVQAH
ncbi:MAG: hypothetical protein WD042_13640 [Phycisphaeraceae bacterium]